MYFRNIKTCSENPRFARQDWRTMLSRGMNAYSCWKASWTSKKKATMCWLRRTMSWKLGMKSLLRSCRSKTERRRNWRRRWILWKRKFMSLCFIAKAKGQPSLNLLHCKKTRKDWFKFFKKRMNSENSQGWFQIRLKESDLPWEKEFLSEDLAMANRITSRVRTRLTIGFLPKRLL